MATTKMIQSLERAAMILELFQNQVTELGLKEIVEKTGLNKSTAFGIVNTIFGKPSFGSTKTKPYIPLAR